MAVLFQNGHAWPWGHWYWEQFWDSQGIPQRMFSDLSCSFGTQADSAMPLLKGSSKNESWATHLFCPTMTSCQKASILLGEAKNKQVVGSSRGQAARNWAEQDKTGPTKRMHSMVLIGHLWPLPWKHLHFYRKQVDNFVLYLGTECCLELFRSQAGGLQRRNFK